MAAEIVRAIYTRHIYISISAEREIVLLMVTTRLASLEAIYTTERDMTDYNVTYRLP